MSENKSHRRIARERVLQVLYAYKMHGEFLNFLTDTITSDLEYDADKEFSRKLINYVIANIDEIDGYIKMRIDNWEIERIALVDKILLQICIAEILFFPDIPPKVSINEAIEIAKEFSTSNSGKFINGILDALLNDFKTAGKLKKTGRGLVEETQSKRAN